ncbi:MAG: two-component system sensor histidine kinase RegB [Paraglaciecola psychrophila]|jgi:two-component system sensor histidine kinase RegB
MTMNSTQLLFSAPHNNMRRLLVIRAMFLGVCTVAIIVAGWLQLPLSYGPIGTILGLLVLVNLLSGWRLSKTGQVSDGALFVQLSVDLLSISLLLYFLGGADNPFVSYYLVPISLATVALPWMFVLPLTVFALAQYVVLFYFNIPLPDLAEHQHGSDVARLNLHSLGMGFNFLISALIITYFGLKMAQALRRQDAELAAQREDNWRDEQLLAVATLAAGTAHDLASPLTAIKTLASELCYDYRDQPQLLEDLELLRSQVVQCSTTLQQLHERAQLVPGQENQRQSLRDFCLQLTDRWLLLHPQVSANIAIDTALPAISAILHPSLEQSIANLLNNAAEASPEDIAIVIAWDEQQLRICIDDCGPGISEEVADRIGQPFNSSKGRGRGLGLFLTHATITRIGGSVSLENRPAAVTGTRTVVSLPLKQVHSL